MENESNVSQETTQAIQEDTATTTENKSHRESDLQKNTVNMRHTIENLKREKAELLDARKLSENTAKQLQEVSKKLSTVEAALGLYSSCPDYSKLVTPEAEKKYAEKFPATYAALRTSGDQYLVGASLYENITNMYGDSEKNNVEEKIRDNKENLQLSPENQLSSFSGKIDGEINEERERQARDLRERIMSGQM